MLRYLSCATLVLITSLLSAQSTPREILTRLFAGMAAGDSTGMSALFAPGATLQSVSVDDEGMTTLTPGSIPDWLTGVAGAEPGALDEQLHYTELRTDGALATAWTPYTFVLNGEVHHCGTNAFQLVEQGGNWRIVHIIDTRNTEGCTAVNPTPARERIEELATNWHRAAARADLAAYFGALTDDAIYIGTDPGEHWTKDQFLSFAKPYFEAGKAWDFTAAERHIFYDENEDIAYWDELLDTWMGPCRGTAVVRRDATGAWKIAHYTLSMAIPNDRSAAVIGVLKQ